MVILLKNQPEKTASFKNLLSDSISGQSLNEAFFTLLKDSRVFTWFIGSGNSMNLRQTIPFGALAICGVIWSSSSSAQPVIAVQPENQTNIAGTTAIFTVGATGEPPLSYQWRSYSSANVFTNIPWGGEAALLLTNVQPTSRRFGVVATDVSGSATSTLATLTVLLPPNITTQPLSQTLEAGSTATFTVAATGTTPLYYQWRQDEMLLLGRTNADLTLANVQPANAGKYTVVITNVAGVATSLIAELKVSLPLFSLITNSPPATNVGYHSSSAWADYDDDGMLDLFISRFRDGPNLLFHNEGNGVFARVINNVIALEGGGCGSSAWADYDNDGLPDLFVARGDSAGPRTNWLYHNVGNGAFARIIIGDITTDLGTALSCAWGDYDNDGYLDLFLGGGYVSTNFLYHNNGDGTFAKVTSGSLVTEINDAVGNWGDFDSDGDLDLFLVQWPPYQDVLYRNDGAGSFTRVKNSVISDEAAQGNSGAWGDYDNDGDLDLFVGNFGNDFLYRNNGGGTFSRMAANEVGSIVSDGGSTTGSCWGDYDNDGDLDLFVANEFVQQSFLYENTGDGRFRRVSGIVGSTPAHSHGGSWADYDSDGFLDLLVTNGGDANQPDRNFLFHNNGNSNHWLNLRLVGTRSNRSAIGAKVRLKATIAGAVRWQLREISGGNGYAVQAPLNVHFGLGDATAAETIRIEWPSGVVQALHDVPAGKFIKITEPVNLQAIGIGEFEFASWRGMRFEIQASSDLTTWQRLSTVTNLAGAMRFNDLEAASVERRFYRVVPLP